MTQSSIAIGAGFCLLLTTACGPRLECGRGTQQSGDQCVPVTQAPDPLWGAWTKVGDTTARICEFFGNGEWNNACFLTSGFAGKWERISENRYYIGASYYACDTQTTFSEDRQDVTLSMLCESTQTQTLQLSRVR